MEVRLQPEHLIKIDAGSLGVQDGLMAMGKRGDEQEDLFVTHQQLRSQGHPFYRAMNKALREKGFDRYVEGQCAKFYARKMGRQRQGAGDCLEGGGFVELARPPWDPG